MDVRTALLTLKEFLEESLDDPYVLAGGQPRPWIHTDSPLASARHPRIQFMKINNPTTVLSIGNKYAEQEDLFVNIWFHTKTDFKIVLDGQTVTNELLVEEYLHRIKRALKSHMVSKEYFDVGIKGFKPIGSAGPTFNEETSTHVGVVTVHVRYFIVEQ